jgi:hypothetical protein
LFKGKKELTDIEFLCDIEYLKDIEEVQPQPAVNFLPEWWKKMPYAIDIEENKIRPERPTARRCPSFPDYFSNGFVIPMWADTTLYYNSKTGDWRWRCGNLLQSPFKIDIFESYRFQDYGSTYLNGQRAVAIWQFTNPWTIVTPPGYYVLQLPLFFNDNTDFATFPGTYDPYAVSTNKLEVAIYADDKEIFIKRGTPLVQYIPYKKEKFNLNVREKNEKDKEFEKKKITLKSTVFGLAYNQLKGRDFNL